MTLGGVVAEHFTMEAENVFTSAVLQVTSSDNIQEATIDMSKYNEQLRRSLQNRRILDLSFGVNLRIQKNSINEKTVPDAYIAYNYFKNSMKESLRDGRFCALLKSPGLEAYVNVSTSWSFFNISDFTSIVTDLTPTYAPTRILISSPRHGLSLGVLIGVIMACIVLAVAIGLYFYFRYAETKQKSKIIPTIEDYPKEQVSRIHDVVMSKKRPRATYDDDEADEVLESLKECWIAADRDCFDDSAMTPSDSVDNSFMYFGQYPSANPAPASDIFIRIYRSRYKKDKKAFKYFVKKYKVEVTDSDESKFAP